MCILREITRKYFVGNKEEKTRRWMSKKNRYPIPLHHKTD